ncbi:Gfo/Idh/MocA family protein [Pseudomonas fluorescens]|uniref:Gfo/Idh/MocA family protein n=1 Tax=Pseudomonas fluorescens TaxID=294 RepID=UPI0010E95B8E|nr:Gfo/Idh/MocA family oxidoreductase [Pseudomonas fluorescens]TCV66231.1 putative dehydrogenase [Pseudomonas fluorescens]
MIRYAVVGLGWISRQAFLPAVLPSGNSVVTALVSGTIEKAKTIAAEYGIERVVSYADYDELVSCDLIDAVYIAVPNSLHAAFAIKALEQGKHVMVEKPIATSLVDAQAMIAVAQRCDALLMTSYRLHHDVGTVEALQSIRSGAIGEPRFFGATFTFQSDADNHRLKPEHWGGPLQDIGIYCINAARHVFSAEPVEVLAVRCRNENDPRFLEVSDSIAVTLRFPGQRLAQFFCSFAAYPSDTYQVVGTEGVLNMQPGFRFERPMAMTIEHSTGSKRTDFAHYDHFAGQIAYFSNCIANGTRPVDDGEEGLADLRVLLAIERSASNGVPVSLEPQVYRHGPDTFSVRMIEPVPHV